ncbi:MAG: serine hydrolase [Planctomycetales bacterium]|nr:serine hydrolase [Planctomycetales bacterium]
MTMRSNLLYKRFCMLLLATFAGTGTPLVGADSLPMKLAPLIAAHEGKVAVAIKHLKTGETFSHQADVPMPTASLIKLPIMVEAYRQAEAEKIDLKKMITLRQEDKAPGSGILTQHFSPGMSLPLVDAVHLMIVYSDNTATNLVLDQIGLSATNGTMEKLGLANTKIHSKVFRGDTSILTERSKKFGLGSTTAGEMVALLEMLENGKLAGAEGTKEMRRHLAACEDKRLSRHYPPEIKVLQKTGSVTAVRTVAGIIELPSGNVAVCVLTNDNKDRRWAADNAGEVLAANIGRILLEHFQPDWRTAIAEASPILRVGSQGKRVELVQRALNEKLSPSPELNLDGEFGPVTRAAVVTWQKANKLSDSGEINLEAWKLLGLSPDQFRSSNNPAIR